MRGVTRALCLLLGLAACAPAAARAETTDRFTRTLTFSPRKPVRVEATIADLTILGSNRSDLSIEIVRHAPSAAALAKFAPHVDDSGDVITITAVQDADGRDADLKSDIVIRAPASTVMQAVRVFEGRVRVSGLTAACDVDLRRGTVEATGLAGRVRLESGIGSVDVKDSQLTPDGMMRLRVFNGPLRVHFQRPPANARILAVTFNGALTSDIPLTMKDKFGPRFGETTLGTGEPVMSVDVVKGDIAITVAR
jgi:hypothetical protein